MMLDIIHHNRREKQGLYTLILLLPLAKKAKQEDVGTMYRAL